MPKPHWSWIWRFASMRSAGGTAIGAVLSGGGLVGATLSLIVGVSSDQFRRKPFLLTYEAVSCICAFTALFTTKAVLLGGVIILAGFGRGASGAAEPLAPAEQAWLAEAVDAAQRGFVYSLNTALGFFAMALGALAAALPAIWRTSLGNAGGYRPLFGIVLSGNSVNLRLLMFAHERHQNMTKPKTVSQVANADALKTRIENRFLRDLMGLNALNGLTIALTGPLIAYWFQPRFHVGP